jgi:hypothetical protein
MKPDALVGLALLGVAAWLLFGRSGRAMGGPTAAPGPRTSSEWARLFAALPREGTTAALTARPDIGLAQGALMGAQAGSNPALLGATGGWSLAVGAGGGALASFFT